MDEFDAPIGNKRTGMIVIILVLLGLGGVGVGGYMVWKKKNGGPAEGGSGADSAEVEKWCKLRVEWAKKVDPLAGDVMLKSVKAEDSEALETLVVKRNKLCQDYAQKVRDLKVIDTNLQQIEIALVKEGKSKANVAVAISNATAKLTEMQIDDLNKQEETLKTTILNKINKTKATAQKEIGAAMAALGDMACKGIYRGPMTDQGTSGNPYVSWDELEMQRSTALKKIGDQIKALEPVVQYTNRVYHEMIRLYRPTLSKCYKKAKRANPKMSEKLGLRVRLKKGGKVKSLAIEWMINRDEKILDCLLETAGKWKLPAPSEDISYVVVSLDFTTI